MLHTQKDLNELLICKEQELKELQTYQINFLKTKLQETERQLHEIHRKFNRLKEDFTYNLKVLEERDRELEHFDTLLTQLKIVENAKDAEVSDLKIQVDKLQQALNQETKNQEALQFQYQQKLKEHQLDLERLLSSKDSAMSHHCKGYENMKRQLERKLQEIEDELALQQQELLVEFDAEMKKKEHEFRQKADEMSNLVLSLELKVKLLTKELEALKDAGMKAAESMKVAEAANLDLEKEVKCKDWEIKDLVAVKDAQIQDLESRLESVQMSWEKEKELSERKHAAIDHLAREKDRKLTSMKEAHVEQMHKWENKIRELQINKETLEMELHQAEWRYTDCLREKEAAIEKYKQQLLLASEREEALERAKVQVELDWRRHSENAERDQYQKSEALIQSLLIARDQVTAELQKKEQKLHEVEMAMSSVTLERDQAVEVLKKHELLPEGTKQMTLKDNIGATEASFLSPEIQRLQEQNNNLRAVIAEMRREMETLNNEESSSDRIKMKTQNTNRTPAVSLTSDYVLYLEEEVRKLKNKCWAMNKELENTSQIPSKFFATSLNASHCNKNTQTSCEDISKRKSDEITGASLKKHEAKAPHVDLTGIQENAMTRRLQDDSIHLKQCFFDKGTGDGPHQHAGNYAKVMKGKLKEAVKKISNLSKEKQQLLEMVNRLRAELGAVSKEGSQNSQSSKQTQGCIFLGALHPKEVARETKHRLLALEHLQYQLTSQIQARSESFFRNDTVGLQENEILVPLQDPQLRKENPSQLQQGQLPSPGTDSSLQDVWQILERGSNPSILSARSNNDQEEYQDLHGAEKYEETEEKACMYLERAQSASLTITGNKFNVQPKLKPNKSSYILPRKLHTSKQTNRIRNYNVKD
ncbi:coiled-coil domain-containing protein 57 isoform X2 [Paroedura picta]|uniref:coiled-coil domain-containing protein 57 isoform X2 n=1 Tax=Paroedura picta TaxID=143630 RepID=UPI0040577E5A